MKKILLIGATLILATGCSAKTKKTLGLTETMPDEYQVKRVKPLEVPPHYNATSTKKTTTKTKKKSKLSKAEEALLTEVK